MRRGILRRWLRAWRGSKNASHGHAPIDFFVLFFEVSVNPSLGLTVKSVATILTYVCQDSAHTFRGDRRDRHERDRRGAAESRLQGFRVGLEKFGGDAAARGAGRGGL